MNIFIDCEWNDFNGDLISMALCSEFGGHEFYEVLPCGDPSEWVKENVIPILGKEPISMDEFQRKLKDFLSQFICINVIADCPEDISMFCKTLITGPVIRLNTPAISMMIIVMHAESEKPHNALYDARGLRKAVIENS